MGVLTTHGMGPGHKSEKCERCGVDTKGRVLHLVFPEMVSRLWICDDCFWAAKR